MKDKELKLEDVKGPPTLGGASYILLFFLATFVPQKHQKKEHKAGTLEVQDGGGQHKEGANTNQLLCAAE